MKPSLASREFGVDSGMLCFSFLFSLALFLFFCFVSRADYSFHPEEGIAAWVVGILGGSCLLVQENGYCSLFEIQRTV